MAKGAAKESELGALHNLLAKVFEKTLQKYIAEMEIVDNLDLTQSEDLEESFIAEFMKIKEPSPAMLSAISKFLKDNEVLLDSEEVDKLSSTQRRLAEKAKARKDAGVDLGSIPVVSH